MLTTMSIVDRLREVNDWSEYRTAQMLEVSHQAVQKWRKLGQTMSDETALKAADLLGLPPEFVLSNIHAERARNSPAFDALERIAKLVERDQQAEIEAAQGKKRVAA